MGYSTKTFKQANSICESVCGAMYFPSSLAENNEVFAIKKKHTNALIWIRISDEEKEKVWKDPDNKEMLTFTNRSSDQPNNYDGKQHWGSMMSDGKWNDKE